MAVRIPVTVLLMLTGWILALPVAQARAAASGAVTIPDTVMLQPGGVAIVAAIGYSCGHPGLSPGMSATLTQQTADGSIQEQYGFPGELQCDRKPHAVRLVFSPETTPLGSAWRAAKAVLSVDISFDQISVTTVPDILAHRTVTAIPSAVHDKNLPQKATLVADGAAVSVTARVPCGGSGFYASSLTQSVGKGLVQQSGPAYVSPSSGCTKGTEQRTFLLAAPVHPWRAGPAFFVVDRSPWSATSLMVVSP